MVALCAHGASEPHGKPAEPPPAPPPPAADGYAFAFDTLLEDASRRAQKPYAPQRSTLPAGLDKLSPEQYRSTHFNPDAEIWRSDDVPFRLELFSSRLPTSALRAFGTRPRHQHGRTLGRGIPGIHSFLGGTTGPARQIHRHLCPARQRLG